MTTKKYWFYNNPDSEDHSTVSFDTLDEARAALRKQIAMGRSGGVIFGPRKCGVMIPEAYSGTIVWYTGNHYCPVRENGSIISGKRAQEIIGF